MLYGEKKRREMARSVLPSKSRKSSREDLRAVARSHRRSGRQALREMRGVNDFAPEADEGLFAEVEDLLETRLSDVSAQRRSDIKWVVRDRREADKLRPLMRWAPKAVAHLEPADRLPTLRSWLPDGIIGWHAMTHLMWVDGLYDEDAEHHYRYYFGRRRYDDEQRLAEQVAKVEAILDKGMHAELNRRLKRNLLGDRLLMGRHDVEDFALDVLRRSYRSYGGGVTASDVVEGLVGER